MSEIDGSKWVCHDCGTDNSWEFDDCVDCGLNRDKSFVKATHSFASDLELYGVQIEVLKKDREQLRAKLTTANKRIEVLEEALREIDDFYVADIAGGVLGKSESLKQGS